ncbi:YjbE family integral membrane protein [Brevibacillus aydinogluensis]|jgi:YjbE family integral membrane protein|uniref:TerC family protein n=1 Tax=Brevibacillus aydinogluensis TaxID=927786 RepID=A0AA48RBM1_9BACL|nr:TerC family protein [Brevibacillus aydinogluensis]MDT3416674.1 YjbE family integral membrane protein [Brevibacillus aydinogluensis]CAJ1001764.1 TerC family protein [Brevibacillus aydinogluensis]
MDGQFWLGFVHIFLIDVVLSSDNAVVIGMACRRLPEPERRRAVLYGTLGAILMRVLLTGMATWMLDIPLVKAVGGVLLLWIACKLIFGGGQEETIEVRYGSNVGQAVKTILLADFVMSLDNVLAVGGAAHGDIVLVILGLGMSISLLMWGSTWISRLMNRFHSLVIVGGGILAYTATDMCLEDPYVWNALNPLLLNHAWLPLLVAVAVMALGRFGKT